MTPFEARLVDFYSYANSVNPQWGKLVHDVIVANYQPSTKMAGFGAFGDDNSALSDIVGTDITQIPISDPSSSDASISSVLDGLTNLVSGASNYLLTNATTIAQTQSKLNALKIQGQIQAAQNQNALSTTKSTTATTFLMVGIAIAAIYMTRGRKK